MNTSSNDADREIRSLLKLVHVGVLVSLLWKVNFFVYAVGINQQFPLVDPFFPPLFRSLNVAIACYGVAVVASGVTLFLQRKPMLVAAGATGLLALAILCVHQKAYNDVTFLCCAWTSLWALWLSTRLGESFDSLYPRAVWLSHVILSLIFLGGTIGKLTPGYWSGEVLYEIYFQGRDFWTYNLIRDSVSADQMRSIAAWHSRMVLVFEAICCFLWLMPRKVASTLAIVVFSGIALTNNLTLFSVVTSLICLAIVGLHEPREKPERADSAADSVPADSD